MFITVKSHLLGPGILKPCKGGVVLRGRKKEHFGFYSVCFGNKDEG